VYILLFVLVITPAEGHSTFQQSIPNGEIVPHPCKSNFLWRGVGHENINGGGNRNPFGMDFEKNGKVSQCFNIKSWYTVSNTYYVNL
jgi:dopamine beta-monooxygenase